MASNIVKKEIENIEDHLKTLKDKSEIVESDFRNLHNVLDSNNENYIASRLEDINETISDMNNSIETISDSIISIEEEGLISEENMQDVMEHLISSSDSNIEQFVNNLYNDNPVKYEFAKKLYKELDYWIQRDKSIN